MEKPRLYVIGASHANRIYQALKRIPQEEYSIINHTIPGAKWKNIVFPNPAEVKSSDRIIIQCLGNDLFPAEDQFWLCGSRHLHFQKINPNILQKLTQLKGKINRYQALIIILDLVPRLACCSVHEDRRLITEQNQVNGKLKHELTEAPNTIVLNTASLAGGINSHLYKDPVHYKPRIYKKIAEQLLTKYCKNLD